MTEEEGGKGINGEGGTGGTGGGMEKGEWVRMMSLD